MIWTDKTHSYAATLCQHTGRPCPAAARVIKQLTQAVHRAGAATSPDFEMDGSADIQGCERGCTARFVASQTQIRLFCGAPAGTAQTTLDRFADALFDMTGAMMASSGASGTPCAMLQARPRPSQPRLPDLVVVAP